MTETTPEARVAELEARLADMEQRTTQRLVQSELKTHALRAGLIDLDALKLLDATSLKLDEHGNLPEAARLMTDLRRAKPYLFAAANTSTPQATPPTSQPEVKKATQMTHAEWQTARAELLRRR